MSCAPRATIRLQLHKDFNFDQAASQVAFLAKLGLSHLYLSPIHTARAGSTHGYDVVDYSNVNAELGGEEGFRKLVNAAREHGMGIIVDLVPNHMAIGGHENRVWLDLLEWGRHSRYADFFDVDWDVPDPALQKKVHAPFLGKPYGEVLLDGDIRLHLDKDTARIYAAYYDHHFPIAAKDYAWVLQTHSPEIAALFRGVADNRSKAFMRFEQAKESLVDAVKKDPQVAESVQQSLNEFNPETETGRNRLHRLLEKQHYRLAWWQTAADEINWLIARARGGFGQVLTAELLEASMLDGAGVETGGARPYGNREKQAFAGALDRVLSRALRGI